MFKKLLSNLPFNPSLIHQVAFYAQRLHREESLRRTGFILVVLAILVQMFAVISPPEPTLAAGSDNDIIKGGFETKGQAVLHCLNQPAEDFGKILEYYKVSCQALDAAVEETLAANALGNSLYSMGRVPQGFRSEYSVNIPGARNPLYFRKLSEWGSTKYKMLRATASDGRTIRIMFSCGNIVLQDTPPAPPPAKSPASIELQVVACDGVNRRNHFGGYAFDTDKPSRSIRVTLFVDGTKIQEGILANVPRPDVNNYFNITGNHGFEINYPTPDDKRTHTVWITAAGIDSNGNEDGNNKKSAEKTFTGCSTTRTTPPPPPPPSEPPVNPPNTPDVDVCPNINGNQASTEQCKPCDGSSSSSDVAACLVLSKTARNDTQKIDNADKTTAAPNDRITYTLTVQNTGQVEVEDFVVEENMADVLEYARIVDSNGATLDDNKILRWRKADIAAGQTLTRKLTIKVKDKIPETPSPPSNPDSYNLLMTNVYGNAVNIRLPGSPAKIIEQTTVPGKTLPNTGPGEVIVLSVGLVVVVSYYFARARLLAKEVDIVRAEYAASGSPS